VGKTPEDPHPARVYGHGHGDSRKREEVRLVGLPPYQLLDAFIADEGGRHQYDQGAEKPAEGVGLVVTVWMLQIRGLSAGLHSEIGGGHADCVHERVGQLRQRGHRDCRQPNREVEGHHRRGGGYGRLSCPKLVHAAEMLGSYIFFDSIN